MEIPWQGQGGNVTVDRELSMVTVKEKPIWQFTVGGTQATPTQSRVTARDKTFIVDEPIARGGTDEGPMPVEYVFMGLAGCTHVIANKLARAAGINFTSMDIQIEVTMDSHGTRLVHPIDIPFPEIILHIKADYEGPRDGAFDVVDKLRHHCAVSKMLQQSGTKIVEHWTLNGEDLPVQRQ